MQDKDYWRAQTLQNTTILRYIWRTSEWRTVVAEKPSLILLFPVTINEFLVIN